VLTWQRPWPRSPPRLREEAGLDRPGEDPVRVVSETLQLDAAGACLFSYLLKAEPDGYSDGLCRACAPHAPAYRAVCRDPLSSASLPFPYLYIEVAMVIIAFVGAATFDKLGTGATSILQTVIWVSPKCQLRNATLAPSYASYASCAAA
jgi:hypothetical protein